MPVGVADPADIRWMLADRFRRACVTGDTGLLASVLASNPTVVVDGGGAPDVPRRPIRDVRGATAFLVQRFGPPTVTTATVQSVNGQSGVVFRRDRQVTAIACFEIVGLRIRTVWLVVKPAALRHWNGNSRSPNDFRESRHGSVGYPVLADDRVDCCDPTFNERHIMKIAVIGGTGLIGSTVIAALTEHGHEAVAASPSTGVNTITGHGVESALDGADVVVDVSNSPSFADDDVMEFFLTSTGNLLAAERAAGVGHHVALSIVGAERLPASGYLRAKVAQEKLIADSGLAYSLVRATQFFEFAMPIADSATEGNVVRLTPAAFQPAAAADVAAQVARAAAEKPLNGIREVAGPERFGLDEWIRRVLAAIGDSREVVTDPAAPYFGAEFTGSELVPGPDAAIGKTSLERWLEQTVAR